MFREKDATYPSAKFKVVSNTILVNAASPNTSHHSILLISPTNQILLLHRVSTSSAFANVHVFPGGNLSSNQDGEIPPPEHSMRHRDSLVYRLGAIRECFEETGILLARKLAEPSRLLELEDDIREEGRHAVHQNKVKFLEWLKDHGGRPDTGASSAIVQLSP